MKPLWNLTLHEQGPQEIAHSAGCGLALESVAQGMDVAEGQEGLRSAVEDLLVALCACHAAGAAALIGGHTGLWVAAILVAKRRSIPLPALYCFETRRHRDENGRFRFVAEGLLEVKAE